MSKYVMLLVLVGLGVWTARAYPPAPASQTAVNAGTEPYLYVTPKTLAGRWGNDAAASAYISANNIASPIAQQAVIGQFASAKAFGIRSNLVALLDLRPEYNPTNHIDALGNKWAVVNEQYTNGGFYCAMTNGFTLGGFGLTNYTLVVTINKQVFAPNAAAGGAGFNPALFPNASKSLMFSFENTNTGSGQYFDQGEYYGAAVYQSYRGIWPYATNVNNLPHLNTLGMLNINPTLYTAEKNVYCLSCSNGVNYLWVNTLPTYQGSQALTCSVLSTDLLQQITCGISTNFCATLWNSNPQYHTNGFGVYESVQLYNIAADPAVNTNLIYGSYKIAQWPDWNLPYQIGLGDSIMAPIGSDRESPTYSASYTNDFFYLLNNLTPLNPNWMDLAQGGSSLATCLTNLNTSAPWPISPVAYLPQLDMGIPITIWSDEGRNDQPTNTVGNELMYSQWLTQFASPYKALGPAVYWNQIEDPPAALTNLLYSVLAHNLQCNSNIAAWNLTARSNSVVNRSFPFWYAMGTNNLAMGAGLSGDGVHAYTNNAAYLALAEWAMGIQTDILTPSYSGNVSGSFIGNGSGLTNLVSLVYTNSPQNFLTATVYKTMPAAGVISISCVVTNSQIVWLTNQTSHNVVIMGNTTGVWTNYDNATLFVNSGDSVGFTNAAGSGGSQLTTSVFQALH